MGCFTTRRTGDYLSSLKYLASEIPRTEGGMHSSYAGNALRAPSAETPSAGVDLHPFREPAKTNNISWPPGNKRRPITPCFYEASTEKPFL